MNHSLLWEPLPDCHALQKSSSPITPPPLDSISHFATLLVSSLCTCLSSPLDCVFLKHHDLFFVISEFPEPQECQFNGEFLNEYLRIECTKFLFTCCPGVIYREVKTRIWRKKNHKMCKLKATVDPPPAQRDHQLSSHEKVAVGWYSGMRATACRFPWTKGAR